MRVNRFLPQGFISFLHRSEGESVLHLVTTIAVRRAGVLHTIWVYVPLFCGGLTGWIPSAVCKRFEFTRRLAA